MPARRPAAPLSLAMQDVLRACHASPDGVVAVADLVAARMTATDLTQPVARASLSRTLRRLWRDELVELCNAPSQAKGLLPMGAGALVRLDDVPDLPPTPTDYRWDAPRRLATEYRERALSREGYRKTSAFRRKYGMTPAKTFAAHTAEYLARAELPQVRATWVRLTDAGQRMAARLPKPPKPRSRGIPT